MRTRPRPPIRPCGTSAPYSHSSALATCLRCARRNLRQQAWRVSRLRPLSSRARDGIHEVRATSRRYAPPIPSRDVRASRHPPAALPSPVELGAAASGSQATACVARRSQDTTASSHWAGRLFHQRQRSYGNASLVAPRSLIAMPCLSVLDGFRVGNSAHTRASAQRGVRRSRPRLTSAQ